MMSDRWLIFVILGINVFARSIGQSIEKLPPKERGLILTVFHDDGDPDAAQIRHLPILPGFENFNGSIKGIKFGNRQIQLLSADIDFRNNKSAYFYDYHLRSILSCTGYNADLNVSNIDCNFMHVGVSRGTVQLAVDWLSHTVYWSDSVYRWIVAAPGQKEKIDLDYYKIIVDDHLEAPDGLAVDPINGILFWSDNGKYPKIERSDLMGNNRHTIITENLVSPLSMEADLNDQRIYWLDSYTESVLSAKYDGSDVTMVTRVPKATLLDLATFRDVVYLVDIKNGDVFTVNKTGGTMESTVLNIKPETVYGIAVYAEEKQPMKDTDYCAQLYCEHLCLTTINGSQCVCSEGYRLNATTRKCDETYRNTHKALLFANTTHICSVDIRSFASFSYETVCLFTVFQYPPQVSSTSGPDTTPSPTPTAQTPSFLENALIKMFDLDMENRIAYFVNRDNSIYSRVIDLPFDNYVVDEMTQASGNVSGLAFDAEDGNNLFWSESDTGNIFLINVNDKVVRRVNPDNVVLKNPRNLIVLQAQRKLAWIGGSGRNMSIETMNMDGSSFTVLVSGQPDIVSLVFDKEKKLFYYMAPSNKSAYSVGLNISGTPSRLSVDIDSTAYLLIHYNNFLAWVYIPSDPQYKHLMRTYEFAAKVANAHGYFDNYSIPVDVKVLDVKLQSIDQISPCANKMKNDCEHICITKYTNNVMTKSCECRLGYKLDADQKTCRTTMVDDNFILVSDWTNNALQQINLQDHSIHAFPNDDSAIYMGVFYDQVKKKVLWSQYQDSRIYSANLNGTDKKIYANLGTSKYAYRFSKDVTTGNLYYTAYYSYYSYVGFVTPSGKVFNLKTVLFNQFGAIAVHPDKGWCYYTVSGSLPSYRYIARSDMDGKNLTQVIKGSYIGYPDGLAIDFKNDHLFWSDAAHDTIQRCDLEGKSCTTIVNISYTDSEQIRDLATDGNYLYYSAYKKDHVVRVNLQPPYNRTIVGQNIGLGKLDTMAFYSSSNMNTQPVSKACEARAGLGDCSTICVPSPAGRTCMCEDGIQLKPDGRTCSDVYQCRDVIRQHGNTVVKITFEQSCLRHLGDTCPYNCPTNYIPTGSGQLTCLNVGWDNETSFLCKETLCPAQIQNGLLDSNCKFEIGDVCDFTCNPGYIKTTEKAFCSKDLTYHGASQLCTRMTTASSTVSTQPVTAAALKDDSSKGGISKGGAIAAIVILVIVVVGLIGVVVFLVRRSMAGSGRSLLKASFHQNGREVAIENPGYLQTNPQPGTSAAEGPYTTLDPSLRQSTLSTDSNAGFGNPLYGRESMSEAGQLDLNSDMVVLTTDSWQREKELHKP